MSNVIAKIRPEVHIPDARMRVRRVDGTIEFDAGTDAFAVLVQEIRDRVMSIAKLAPEKMGRRRVVATVATLEEKPGGVEVTPTITTPGNGLLAGEALFGTLMAVRAQNPAAFARLIQRLRDEGLLTAVLTP